MTGDSLLPFKHCRNSCRVCPALQKQQKRNQSLPASFSNPRDESLAANTLPPPPPIFSDLLSELANHTVGNTVSSTIIIKREKSGKSLIFLNSAWTNPFPRRRFMVSHNRDTLRERNIFTVAIFSPIFYRHRHTLLKKCPI